MRPCDMASPPSPGCSYSFDLLADFDFRDSLFEDIHRNIRLFARDDERWSDANRAGAAAEEEDALGERSFDDLVAQISAVLFGLLILHDFDADHQPPSAHVADDFVFLRPVRHPLDHVCADLGGVLEQAFFLDHIKRCHGGCDTDGIAAEGGCMRAGDPIHDLRARHGDAERHAGGNALGHANDIRLHSRVLDGDPLAGAADAALDFVYHQQNAVAVANAAQFLHERRRCDDVAAFAL